MFARFSILLMTFSIVLLAPQIGRAECRTNYAAVLAPSGMSAGIGWDGKSRPRRLKCYAETALGKGVSAVVFSEETITGSADSMFKVRLALVSLSEGNASLLHSVDITQSIPVFVEIPGNFYRMEAIAETLNGHNNLQVLHINVWAVLSGSGAVSGGSDLFYIYKPPNLSPIALELRGSSSFSKENMNSISKKASELFLMRTETETALYVLIREVQVKGSVPSGNRQSTTVYLLHGDKFEVAARDRRVPAAALRLERVLDIATLMAEPGGS
jgi:hypothetical protein